MPQGVFPTREQLEKAGFLEAKASKVQRCYPCGQPCFVSSPRVLLVHEADDSRLRKICPSCFAKIEEASQEHPK